MKKVILTYGLISGAIVSAMLVITQPLFRSGVITIENGVYVGFSTMIISLSLIFFGIKSFRDNQQEGVITFGKAFKIGVLIAVVASICYALSWEVYMNTVGQDFAEWYSQCQLDKLRKEGAAEEIIINKKVELKEFAEMYKNPAIRFGMTLMEIFPIGLIITLVSAALLRKKEFLASTNE